MLVHRADSGSTDPGDSPAAAGCSCLVTLLLGTLLIAIVFSELFGLDTRVEETVDRVREHGQGYKDAKRSGDTERQKAEKGQAMSSAIALGLHVLLVMTGIALALAAIIVALGALARAAGQGRGP